MKDNSGFYIPVLSALVLMGVVLCVYAVSQAPENWMPYVCKPEDCTVQSWLAASAGWVGFVAAAVGAYIVYGQLAEQRKQTAFLLGDALPTVELIRMAGKTSSGILQLFNWNRRTLVITGIEIRESLSAPKVVAIRCGYKNTEGNQVEDRHRIGPDGRITGAIKLGGFVDRQARPHNYLIYLEFDRPSEANFIENTSDMHIDVVLTCAYATALTRRFECIASIPYRGIFPHEDAFFD